MRRRFGRILGLAATCGLLAAASAQDGEKALVSLIRDDLGHRKLDEARALLARGQSAEAVEALIELLAAGPSAVTERDADLWIGLREAARDALQRLDGRAAAVYERRVGGEAGPRLREALASKDPAELALLSLRYPATSWSAAARLAACDLFLEEGRALRALHELTSVGTAAGDDDILARRALCRVLLGLPPVASDLSGDWTLRLRAVRPLVDPSAHWPAYGGPGPALPSVARSGPWVESWSRSLELLGDFGQLDYGSSVHAVADGGTAFVNTGTRLHAFALAGGERWRSASHLAFSSVWEQESFLLAASPNMAHSAAISRGVVVAPLQVPVVAAGSFFPGWRDRRRSPRHLPVRRLFAFVADTGEPLWQHYTGDASEPDPEDLAPTALDVSGPPLAIDDTVYVATHRQVGGIALHVSAFDVKSGRRKWSTLVCTSQIESDRLGQPFAEFAASPLAYEAGVLYGAANLGLCFALRAEDGAIRWLRTYPILPLPVSSGRGRGSGRPQLRTLHWGNSPPVVASGVVVLTPIDSEQALALEASTGQLLWRLPYHLDGRDGQDGCTLRWLLGAAQGFAWFSGQGLCKVALRGDGTPRLVAEQDSDLRDPAAWIPRGFVTDDRVYHPTGQSLWIVDHEGRPGPEPAGLPGDGALGNLCLSAGVLLEVRPGSVRAFQAR